MSPEDLAAHIHRSFVANLDPAFAQGQRRFFQHEVDTYGVRATHLHALAAEVYREIKPWPKPSRDELMHLLWETGKLESGALVCHVYRRFAKTCGEPEFRLFAQWLKHYVHNWAHCDGLATFLLAAAINNVPDLRLKLTPWTKSKNRWERRAAAVALIWEAKRGRHTDFIFEIAETLLPDRDDMVEKGVGWLLKETYPARPAETLAFLNQHREEATRLTLRYAAEKMPPAVRRALLEA